MNLYKPNIFVSSTIESMPNERKAALTAIRQFGGNPIMSEYTINAQNADSIETCMGKVKMSDIYILILGGDYGWCPDGTVSITEMEYITAQQNNKPTLVFNTAYPKEPKQEEFSKRVGATYFWKKTNDVFELKDAIVEALKEETEKWELELKAHTESIYANLLRISFPEKFFIADLNIDREEIIEGSKLTKKWLKKDASWFDVAVSAIHQKEIFFPHDWSVFKKQILTFHDLYEPNIPLSGIIDRGTITPLFCEEFYSQSIDYENAFKSLLRNCLKTKLYKQGIKWFKDEKLFAFMPVKKNALEKWENREIEWERNKTASRTVVKVNYGKKDPNKVSSAKHLAFAADFHLIDNEWYLAVKPDWLITFGDFRVSQYGYEKVNYFKRNERNIHVFNHLNFILWYLQPSDTLPIFDECKDYPFMSINNFLKLESWPAINDSEWRKLESKSNQKKLEDKFGNIELFAK